MGRFFDEQTDDDDDDDGRTDGRRADKKHARTWGQKGSAEGGRRGGVEAVKPEMEKERMADGRTRRAAAGRATAFNFSGQCVETGE